MTRAYIGIGSNLSEPQHQVRQAIDELGKLRMTRLLACSSLYSSAPMGPVDQPDYINAVAVLLTELSAHELFDELLSIETAHGRIRSDERWGPRTLDLDLLLYGDDAIEDKRLTVPHPGLLQRNFVLYPLMEIDPELNIPGYGAIEAAVLDCPRGDLATLQDRPAVSADDQAE